MSRKRICLRIKISVSWWRKVILWSDLFLKSPAGWFLSDSVGYCLLIPWQRPMMTLVKFDMLWFQLIMNKCGSACLRCTFPCGEYHCILSFICHHKRKNSFWKALQALKDLLIWVKHLTWSLSPGALKTD